MLGFKLQRSLESMIENLQQKEIKELEITEEALLKLFTITVFLVRKHLAHSTNYEDFVQFIRNNLKDEVLRAYLEMADSNKTSNFTISLGLSLIFRHSYLKLY